MQMVSRFLILCIRFYQKTLSPDHGFFMARYPYGFCRMYPTCSEYTRLSISRFGVLRGGWLGIKRIIRCNPFTLPRVDNVPRTNINY